MRPVLAVTLFCALLGVGAVDASSRKDVHAVMAELLARDWQKAKVQPLGPASDEEFLRRVSLDLTGRIPDLASTRAFMVDAAPDRRARLVDRLLASSAYAEFQADRLLDVLLGGTARVRPVVRERMLAYLREAYRKNTPYDVLTRELITVAGELEDHPAGGFLFSHPRGGGGPAAAAAATAGVFLGIQLQCAQCHDHPYDDRYKQEDFHALAAYFAQTRARRMKDGEAKQVVVMDVNRGNVRMQRPDGTRVKVMPRFLGRDVAPLAGENRRQTLARAVVASDLFAKAVVNRTWAELFGRGLVQPWNDLGGERDENHPELLTVLATEFRHSGHDVRKLLRTLVLSPAYNRTSALPSSQARQAVSLELVFAKAAVRPLTPFQLLESSLQATGLEDAIRERRGEFAAERRHAQAYREFTFVFGDDEMTEVDAFNGSVPQALLTFNGDVVNRGARARPALALGKILQVHATDRERVEAMYLSTLTRRPSVLELDRALRHIEQAGRRKKPAYEDLYFALLTSTEFSTNH